MSSQARVFILVSLSALLASVTGQLQQMSNNLVRNESTYYTVASDEDCLCLMSSKDLVEWNRTRAIFDEFESPLWSLSTPYIDPEMAMMGDDKVRVFFAATELRTGSSGIGVAFSTKLEADRRYSTLNRPLLFDRTVSFISPSIVMPAKHKKVTRLPLLMYVGVEDKAVHGAMLTEDGLQIEETAIGLLKPTLPWEAGQITQVWGVVTPTKYFMFYTGADESAVGVARSMYPLGPYEKRGEPIARMTKGVLAKNTLMRNLQWRQGWPEVKP